MFITNPETFVGWFKSVVPGAYRDITVQDVRELTECGLIGRHGFYVRQDLETARAILLFERLKNNRKKKDEIRDAEGKLHCRGCGKPLPYQHEAKKGRPREYCDSCERFRAKERYQKWRMKN